MIVHFVCVKAGVAFTPLKLLVSYKVLHIY